jgi:pimeloyl-ACP methyl ester carboxylesterase
MSQSAVLSRLRWVITLAFRRTGTGAPLVLLHGIGSNHGIWDPVIPALSARFDVIAVDLPGFGASPPLPPGVEPVPAALAGAVADLLDELDVETPNVVGNSLGGWVAAPAHAGHDAARLRTPADERRPGRGRGARGVVGPVGGPAPDVIAVDPPAGRPGRVRPGRPPSAR